MRRLLTRTLYSFVVVFASLGPVASERIKDISSIAGVRTNQLVGYGIVVGLAGSGDCGTVPSNGFTRHWFTNAPNAALSRCWKEPLKDTPKVLSSLK